MDRLRSLLMAAALMIAASRASPHGPIAAGRRRQAAGPHRWPRAGGLDRRARRPGPGPAQVALLILGRATPDQAGSEFVQAPGRRQPGQGPGPGSRRPRPRRPGAPRGIQLAPRGVAQGRAPDATVNTVRTPLRLVDVRGQPVAGAVVSTYFEKDRDRSSSFDPSGVERVEDVGLERRGIVGARGPAPSGCDRAVYAMRPEKDRPLVGLSVTREQLGKPITIVMHPACRVRLRVECPGFRELEENYHFELDGSCWWRAAYVMLGDGNRAPRPLFTSSTTGQLEFLLPPGRFQIMAYGNGSSSRTRRSRSGRVTACGTWRSRWPRTRRPGEASSAAITTWRARMPGGRPDAGAVGKTVVLRSVKSGPVFLSTRGQHVGPRVLARRPSAGHGARPRHRLGRGRDSGTRGPAGSSRPGPRRTRRIACTGWRSRPMAGPSPGRSGRRTGCRRPWEIVLWDVDGRRAPRTLRGQRVPDHGAGLLARRQDAGLRHRRPDRDPLGRGRPGARPAASRGSRPDRVDGLLPRRADPGDRGRDDLDLWDWPGRRLRARLESEAVAIRSVAFAPDGRSLAVAGEGPGSTAACGCMTWPSSRPPATRG